MPARSKVHQLPPEVKAELDAELVARHFSDYEELAVWLGEKGYEVSKSSLGRYGLGFQQRVQALRMAREQATAIVAEMGDDAGDMGEALTAVAQEKIFSTLIDMEVDPGSVDLDKLVNSIAKLNSTSVQQKKWRLEARRKAEAAAAAVEERTAQKGLGADDVAFIRQQILGVVA